MKGYVHSIQSLGTVDGPGIRFIAFMQGCPMRCMFCHNPDTWDTKGGREMTASELVQKCLRYREYFGAEGAYLPLNMNQNCVEHPIADYRYTLCGGAYSGLVLAQAWWYTQDEKILREIYPLLKKFILFYTSTMKRDADGTCHFIWSVPPEIFRLYFFARFR